MPALFRQRQFAQELTVKYAEYAKKRWQGCRLDVTGMAKLDVFGGKAPRKHPILPFLCIVATTLVCGLNTFTSLALHCAGEHKLRQKYKV
jgi:hypothetical protein